MALIADFTCARCNTKHYGLVTKERLCIVCVNAQKNENSRERRQYLASLKGLTIEERLSKIEEYLYDTDAAKRLDSLEITNIKY